MSDGHAPPPPDAITLAAEVIAAWTIKVPYPQHAAAEVLAAAAPVLRAEGAQNERQRWRERIIQLAAEWLRYDRDDWGGDVVRACGLQLRQVADLLDGDDDQPPNQNRTEETHA